MALPSDKFSYLFDGGVNQEIDPRVLPNDLLGCRNGVWRRDGRLEKREGQSLILARPAFAGQQALIVRQDNLGVIAQNEWSTVDQAFSTTPRVSEQTGMSIARQLSVQTNTNIIQCDIAYSFGYYFVAYTTIELTEESNFALYIQIIDAETGSVVVPETLFITDAEQVRLESVGSGAVAPLVHMYYLVGSQLRMNTLGYSPLTVGATTVVADITPCLQNATGERLWSYDTSNQSGLGSVVVYWDVGEVPQLITKQFAPDGTLGGTVALGVTTETPGQVAIYASGQIAPSSVGSIILYQEQYGVTSPDVVTIDPAYTMIQAGPTSSGMPAAMFYAGLYMVRSDQSTGTGRRILCIGNDATTGFGNTERIEFADMTLALGAFVNRQRLWGRVVGKPYYYVTQGTPGTFGTTPTTFPVIAVQTYVDSAAQPNIALVAVYGLPGNAFITRVPWGALPVGRLNVDTAQDNYLIHPKQSAVPVRFREDLGSPASADWAIPVMVRKQFFLFDQSLQLAFFETGIDVLRANHQITFPVRYAQTADNSYVAAGSVLAFSGGMLRDQSFIFRPFIEDVVLAGGTLPPGTYRYTAIWEDQDENGDIIRSSPAEVRTVTNPGPGISGFDVRFRLPVYHSTPQGETQAAPTRIGLFRTQAGGSLFFRVATFSGRASGGPYTLWPTLTYTDNVPDADLTEPLYTDSGELPSDPAPAPVDIVPYQTRVAMISGQRSDEVWISKEKAPEFGLEFSSTLVVTAPAGFGELVALAAIDEKLIMLKERGIYAIASDGPNALGQGSFGAPREVSSDIGCNNKHSVVTTEVGVFFESSAGIYLLDRGLNLSYIGGPVVDLLPGAGRRVSRAIAIQRVKEVYFLVQWSNMILCYNYRWNRWTRHDVFDQINDPDFPEPLFDGPHAMLDIANYKGNLTVLSRGDTFTEEPAPASITTWEAKYRGVDLTDPDVISLYSLVIQTPWFKLAGLTGWQRTRNLRFLAEYASAHSLRIRAYYDNQQPPASNTWTYLDAELVPSGGVGNTYTIKIKIPRQKSQSVRFEFEDLDQATIESNSASYRALELMLEYAIKRSGLPIRVTGGSPPPP